MGSMGINFKNENKGYVEISIVALGRDYGEQVFLTKEQLIKKEKVIVEKTIKPKAVHHQEEKEMKEESLFGAEE